jgi:hypothetical protein
MKVRDICRASISSNEDKGQAVHSLQLLHDNSMQMADSVIYSVIFDVFTAVTMKNAVFWDVTPRASYWNRHIGKICRLHL